jgi:hypothetical protein
MALFGSGPADLFGCAQVCFNSSHDRIVAGFRVNIPAVIMPAIRRRCVLHRAVLDAQVSRAPCLAPSWSLTDLLLSVANRSLSRRSRILSCASALQVQDVLVRITS